MMTMWFNGNDTFELDAGLETARLTVGGVVHVLQRVESARCLEYANADFWALLKSGSLVGSHRVLAGRTGAARGDTYSLPLREQLRMNAEAHGITLTEEQLDAEVALCIEECTSAPPR